MPRDAEYFEYASVTGLLEGLKRWCDALTNAAMYCSPFIYLALKINRTPFPIWSRCEVSLVFSPDPASTQPRSSLPYLTLIEVAKGCEGVAGADILQIRTEANFRTTLYVPYY